MPDRIGTTRRRRRARDRTATLPPILFCLASLLFLGWQLRDGLDFVSFMDEATHVLGGRVLLAGGLLYRDFVDSHGPLIFGMAQGYGAVFGQAHDNGVRWLLVACALLACASLGCSAVASNHRARCCGLLLGSGLLGAVWLRQGLYLFSFYPVAGALVSIGLASFVVGACFDRPTGPAQASAAGIAVALLPATAYSFLPAAACLVLAGFWASLPARRRTLPFFLLGLLVGCVLVALWLRRFADLHGALSYHLAENQLVYAHYIDFGWRHFTLGLLPDLAPGARTRTLGMLCLLLSAGGLLARPVRRGPLLLVLLAVLELNARGSDNFQNGAFLWAAITLLALVAMRLTSLLDDWPARAAAPLCALAVLAAVGLERGALFLPFSLPARTMDALPRWPIGDRAAGALFDRIRQVTSPGERILALPYQPQLYLLADRLPMDGFYAWFPWDQDYVRIARFGRGRDLCAALRERPPPVIVVDPSPFWGHAASDYIPCLPAILRDRYQADLGIADIHGTLFVRRDRAGTAGRQASTRPAGAS